ncbi:MAG: ABC transporter permease subunit [Hyphomonadaceae bacterium]
MTTLVSAPAEKEALLNAAAVKGRSLWDDSRRRLLSNKAAMAGFIVLAILILLAVVGPFVWPHSYKTQYREALAIGPTFKDLHLLGTDIYGRDMVARILAGLRISLAVGAIATLVSLVIGVAWGAVAGFAGGRVDQLMMRFVDALYAMPFIFFVILVTVVFGRSIFLIFLAIGAVEWMTMARIVRGQTLALKQKEFVEAARAAGVGPIGIIVRHILPNLLGPVAVYVSLTIPVVILQESFLSFIGLGVQEPLTSLGRLISDGQRELGNPWMLIGPAVTMVITLFSLNFIGDGLRDALDPKDR